MQNLVDTQKEAIRLDDALILSGMKSIKTPPMKEYFCGQQHYIDEEATKKKHVLEETKSTPNVPLFQNLTIFSDEDFQEPLLDKDNVVKMIGFYFLHIENNEECVAQSNKLVTTLNVPVAS